MPTVLRQFPQVNRSGTQQTAYVQLPPSIDYVDLAGIASPATLSDPLNEIIFEVVVSPTGSDVDSRVIAREPWIGGTYFNRFTQQVEPRPIGVNFNLQSADAGHFVALRAIFSRVINVGATLTGLP